MRDILRRFAILALIVAAVTATGCSKKLVVIQYPEFYTPDLKVIAIAPFNNLTKDPNAGRRVSDQLAANLMQNGTYQVLDRARLQDLLNEQDMMTMRGETPAGLDKLQGTAQAILVGSVTSYSATNTRPERRNEQVTLYDNKGRPYQKNIRWTYVKNEATVACSAQLLRIPDGKPIYGTGNVTGLTSSESTPPPNQSAPAMSPNTCLAEANRQAVNKMTERFAVVRKEIKIEKDALTTTASPGAHVEKCDKFFSDTPVYIVVRLPNAAGRNTFDIVVINSDTKQNSKKFEMTWQAGNQIAGQYIEIPASDLAPGKYEVRLFGRHQQKHVLDTKFEISPEARGMQQARAEPMPRSRRATISGG